MTAALTVLPPPGSSPVEIRPRLVDGEWRVEAIATHTGLITMTWTGMADQSTAEWVAKLIAQEAAKERERLCHS